MKKEYNYVFRDRKKVFKALLIMKLWAFFNLMCILSAGAVNIAFSQDSRVSLDYKNAKLTEVLKSMQKQSEYHFLYSNELLNKLAPVSISADNEPLSQVLARCLSNTGLDFELTNDKVILIKEKLIVKAAELPPPITISGKVSTTKGEPLVGATVAIKGSTKGTISDIEGRYSIKVSATDKILVFSYIGTKKQEVLIANRTTINVVMEEEIANLQEVQVVSTGYQSIPKERATGSFQKIDNKTFNYSPGADVLSHLENNVAGMLINTKSGISSTTYGALTNTTFRGPSTMTPTIAKPLIVLDNLAYDGDINNINPNDVESITLLKDAAAASIWGTRSGNGVIVIVTKKSKYNRPLSISINSNVRISEKPRFDQLREVNSSDFIDLEKELFNRGVFDSDITSDWLGGNLLSPVVRILAQRRDNPSSITEAAANAQIDAMRKYNFNDDLLKYVYRNQINQQYALTISEGNDKFSYLLSAGYDKNIAGQRGSNDDRLTLRSNVAFKPVKNLEVGLDIGITKSTNHSENTINKYFSPGGGKNGMYPYAHLADGLGDPLPLVNTYRIEWAQEQGDLRGLDWTYVPLKDRGTTYSNTNAQDLLLKLNLEYKINPVFKAQVLYQYNSAGSEAREVSSKDSYFMRDLINMYTSFPDGNVVRNIPLGGRLDIANTYYTSNTLRGQLNADKTWNGKHQLVAIAGTEIRQDIRRTVQPITTYGWDEELLSYKTVNYNEQYPYYGYDWYTVPIPFTMNFRKTTDRFTSFYTNGSYTYDNRYILSFSARKEASNLFGVKANQKGVPLWSAGASWNISNEAFYKVDWLPYLKFRTTYGFNGNVNNSMSAYMVMEYRGNDYYTQRPWSYIKTPPNEKLKWETVRIINFGLDFALKNNRLSGSIEYFTKKSMDIIAQKPLDKTTGFSYAFDNSGEIKGSGIEAILNTKNIETKNFTWNTNFIFTYNKSKITKYEDPYYVTHPYQMDAMSPGRLAQLSGYDAYPLFSYRFAGLDENGNPQGYIDGILTSADGGMNAYNLTQPDAVSKLVYHGSALPRTYGSVRNTFNWKSFELSVNITYKLGYYFRKSTAKYSDIVGWRIHSDINDRWRVPGDENKTTIPGMPADFSDWGVSYRDNFYGASTATVAKGDHIRLQDIMLSYILNKPQWHVKNIKIYANLSNVGILWRANKWKLDPDLAQSILPNPKIVTFGLTANF